MGKKWSDISREDWQFVEAEKKCFYCGSTENLEKEHIVPKCIKIKSVCENCERILGIHNQIWAFAIFSNKSCCVFNSTRCFNAL